MKNYDALPANTRRMLERYFDVSDDGFYATRRVVPQSIESAVDWCRAERSRKKAMAWKQRKNMSFKNSTSARAEALNLRRHLGK